MAVFSSNTFPVSSYLSPNIDFINLHLPNCQCLRPFPKAKKVVAAPLSHWLRLVVEHNEDFAPPTKQEYLVKYLR